MSDMQWQVGKSYRLVDAEGFNRQVQGYLLGDNVKISSLLGANPFTVCGVNGGKVLSIEEYERGELEILHWFDPEEIKYFELIEDVDKSQPKHQTECLVYTNQTVDTVHEWIMKLGYVISTNDTISGLEVNLQTKEMFICTDFGDITGITQVIDYVNHNYAVKIKQEADKRKQELEDKRLKVLAELSEIDQELGRY